MDMFSSIIVIKTKTLIIATPYKMQNNSVRLALNNSAVRFEFCDLLIMHSSWTVSLIYIDGMIYIEQPY